MMQQQIKILIVGESPALPSGIAEVTRLVFEGLLAQFPGVYDLTQVGLFHSVAVTIPKWNLLPTKSIRGNDGVCRLAPEDLLGQQTIQEALETIKPDILFAVGNPQQLAFLGEVAIDPNCKTVLYLKVDDLPLHPATGLLLQKASFMATMSRCSRDAIVSQFSPKVDVEWLYPPADTDRFMPVSIEERDELRQALFPAWIPSNAFVLGWVGKAQWRKQIWALYRLISYCRKGNYDVCAECGHVTPLDWDPVALTSTGSSPSKCRENGPCLRCGSPKVQSAEPLRDIFLWLHTPQNDPSADWPLPWLEQQYGVKPGRDIYYTDGYTTAAALEPNDMPALYQLWDGLIHLSGSEGFGLPGWEAMSSGVPVICPDYSSPAEYIRTAKAGLTVRGFLQPEERTGYWRMVADLAETIEAVRKIYFDRGLSIEMRNHGRAFVEQHRIEKAVDRWHRVFQGLVQEEGVDCTSSIAAPAL